jgi:membrane-associated phospholipid phosphatase
MVDGIRRELLLITSTVKTGSSTQPIAPQRCLLPRGADPGGTPGSGARVAFWSVVGLFLLYLVFVGTPTGQHVDEELMKWVSATVSSHGWAELILAWVSAGSVLLVAAALVGTTAALRGPLRALSCALAAGATVTAAELLKLTLARPSFLAEPTMNSFPSGHVAAVAGLAAALLIALPARRRRVVALLVVMPAVGLTGMATVVLQWHRPTDVLGSVLLAVVVGGLTTMLTHVRAARPAQPKA